MEKLFFRKIELWCVALLLLVGLVATLFFGAIVKDEVESRTAQNRPATFGRLGDRAYRLASIPETVGRILTETNPLEADDYQRFGTQSGWTRYADTDLVSGYLLLARIDGDVGKAVVELVGLSDLSVRHRWNADPAILFAGASRAYKGTDYSQWEPDRFRVMHPFLNSDGSLTLHGQQSPLVSMDACGRRTMISEDLHVHHSLNRDADGNFWAPTQIEAKDGEPPHRYENDGLAKFAADGTLAFARAIPDLLADHDLTHLVFPGYSFQRSIVHLNDIQPVLADGPYWRKGDVFVSLRRQSMILLYRPSTDEILWMKQGPWVAQHDVDILDDHRIGVFDNHVTDRGAGIEIEGQSDIVVYDFATDTVSRPFTAALGRAGLAAKSNGLFDMTESGHLIVEEDTSGRILLIGPDQTLLADFINRGAGQKVFRMGWSRYISQADGDASLAAIAAQGPCD